MDMEFKIDEETFKVCHVNRYIRRVGAKRNILFSDIERGQILPASEGAFSWNTIEFKELRSEFGNFYTAYNQVYKTYRKRLVFI